MGVLNSARGLTVATAAIADSAIFSVWNPHANKRIRLRELGVFTVTAATAGAGFYLRRCTARGTPGTTVTPAAGTAYEGDSVPQSGWLLDLAVFTVQPTLVALPPMGPPWVAPNSIGAGIIYPVPDAGIIILPGQGLVVVNRAAIIFPASEVYAVVEE